MTASPSLSFLFLFFLIFIYLQNLGSNPGSDIAALRCLYCGSGDFTLHYWLFAEDEIVK